MRIILALALLGLSTAFAQQQPKMVDQLVQHHISLQMNLARDLDAANVKIQELTAEVAKLKAELEQAKAPKK